MSEQGLVGSIVRVISGLGLASLETLLHELEHRGSAIDIARAFQTARARGLIDAERNSRASCDPLYRLTPSGLDALDDRPLPVAERPRATRA